MAASLLSFSFPNPNIIRASSAAPAITLDYLEDKFGRKGIKFYESNTTPFVELTVRNGSSLKLSIPDAHVASYKPKVHWKDDGFEELLYTVPADGGPESGKAKGGIGLVLNDVNSKESSLLSTSEWTVKDSDNDAIDALQVELSCKAGSLDITYVVSLYPMSIGTAVKVKNNGKKEVTLSTAILSHLRFKRRSGTAVQGLRGCSYSSHPPLSSPFELLSPSEAMKSESEGWFGGSETEEKPGEWSVQDVPITILKNKLSRVYAAPPSERLKPFYDTPPSKYETLDQGRELFFRVIRMGFQDIYLGSPGSMSKKYGTDYFICTGPASLLVPVVIKPGESWRGAQVIEHDNL